MEPTYVIAGHLAREYILPAVGQPLLDAAGGSALYAAGGFLVWERELGLLGRVGEDYPRPWLKDLQRHGIDVEGIEIIRQSVDLRAFYAYNENFGITRGSPVSQFARRELTFPKVLLGYQDPPKVEKDSRDSRSAFAASHRNPAWVP